MGCGSVRDQTAAATEKQAPDGCEPEAKTDRGYPVHNVKILYLPREAPTSGIDIAATGISFGRRNG